MEEKESNSKRKFIKTLVKTAAGAALLPIIGQDAFAGDAGNMAPPMSLLPSPSPSPSPSRSPSPSPTPSYSPSRTPTPSTSPSLTPTPSFSPSVTPTASARIDLSPTPTPSASVIVSLSALPVTATPSVTPSPSSVISGVDAALKSEGIDVGTFNPNPTTDRSFLIVVTAKPVDVKVDVYDTNAKSVFRKNYTLRSGSNSLEVELPSGQAGFYQVLLDFNGKVISRRLISI